MSSNVVIRVRENDNFVWDVGTLAWVAMTQPGGGSGGGAATIADGADVALGSTTDPSVVTGNGTIAARLRGLLDIINTLTNALGSTALNVRTIAAGSGLHSAATFSALNAFIQLFLKGNGTFGVLVRNTGNFVGTIHVYGSIQVDFPETFSVVRLVGMNVTDGTGPTDTIALDKLYLFNAGGFDFIQVQVDAYTSGSAQAAAFEGTGSGAINMPLGTQAISAAALPLPASASTAALQTTGNASLGSIDTKLSSQSTAAQQATGNASLAQIDADLDVALSTRASEASLAKLPLAQAASMIGASGPLVQAVVVSVSPSSFVPGEVRPMTMLPDGRLRVATIDVDAWDLPDPFGFLATTPVASDFAVGVWNA